jgi:hypothetical protein
MGARRSYISAFNPQSLGVISAWLRNSTTGALSSVPDVINAANPSTQSTAGRRPAGETDGSITFDGDDVLSWPLVTGQNKNITTLGFAFWFKPTAFTSNQQMICIHTGTGGASASMFMLYAQSNNLRMEVRNNGLLGRRGAATAVFSANTPTFVTGEFNGNMGSESTRHVVTVGGVVQTLAFTAISGGTSDVMLNNATGAILIGGAADADVGSEPIIVGGKLSKNIMAITSAMGGATEGLLTPTARLNLMAFEALT